MSIQIVPNGAEVIAIMVGDLTMATMNDYLPAFVELSLQGWNDVILDMTGVEALDTAGAGLLLALRDRLARQGLELRLNCPQPGPLLLMKQIGLDQTLTISNGPEGLHLIH